MFVKIFDGEYILGVAIANKGNEITEQEYAELTEIFHTTPTAREGYEYKLTANLEWVEVEKTNDEEATAEDYENALADLGVRV